MLSMRVRMFTLCGLMKAAAALRSLHGDNRLLPANRIPDKVLLLMISKWGILNSCGPDVQDPNRNYIKGGPLGFTEYNWVQQKQSLQFTYCCAAPVSQPCRAKPDPQAQFKQ